MKRTRFLLLAIVIFLIGIQSIVFTVDETEYAVVTQFGSPVSILKEPGLYFKFPVPVQNVTRFKNWLMLYDPPSVELLTSDKKNILINSFMLWKIGDPQRFLETVKDVKGAEARLSDILYSQVGATIGSYSLSNLVSTQEGEMKLPQLLEEITKHCAEQANRDYGIQVVDVQMKDLSFPFQNKRSVFERMRAERQRIAKKFRSEGEEAAVRIEAETNREQRRILSEAYREAQLIYGSADAEATKIYAEAFEQNPRFYKFTRTLESYRKFLDDKTTIVMPANSELLKLLSEGQAGLSSGKN